jgi:hypothetical protein
LAVYTSIGTNSSKTASTSEVITLSGAAAIGDLVVAIFTEHGQSDIIQSTVSDSRGNAWTVQLANGTGTTATSIVVAYSVLTVALLTNDTITVAWKAAGNVAVSPTAVAASAIQITGVTSPTIDVFAIATGTSTTPSSGNITTTAASDAMVGTVAANGPSGDTFTAGTSWARLIAGTLAEVGTAGGSATSNQCCDPETQDAGAAGTYAATATITSRTWVAAIVAFKSGTAAVVPQPIQTIQQAVKRASFF